MRRTVRSISAGVLAMTVIAGCGKPSSPPPEQPNTSQGIVPAQARAIAKDAYIYAFPIVDNYRVMHSYFVDTGGPEYKAPWNTLHNTARVYTPDDKAIQAVNSDTPYSQLGADLRTEPLVITVPAVEKGRYYSLQFIDLYTHNFAYVGSRATGNDAGSFLLAGPDWKGEKPPGIKDVIRSETQLAFVFYRTQLFRPDDIENVKKVQAGYKVQPLSQFLGQPAPPAAPAIDFPKPLTLEQERGSLQVFELANFLLQFCPTHSSEVALMKRFATLGIGANGTYKADELSPQIRQALQDGIADAWQEFDTLKKEKLDPGILDSADGFGTREHLGNNYLFRMAAAYLGIYGNSKEEAMYLLYWVDAKGEDLEGSHRYTLRLTPDKMPPVNAFWSVTMYESPSGFLYANPLQRYLINSPMLPGLKRDRDGAITLYLQHQSPGKGKEANWLPAPQGPFFAELRLYWPKEAVLNKTWQQPPLERSN